MKPLLPAFAALIMLFAFSCKRHAEDPANSANAVTESLELMQVPKPEQEKANKKKEHDQLPVKNINADWDKKIIRKAVISVEAENFKSYNAQIHELVTRWEGYIAKEEESGSDNRINNSLTIKVPTDRFDEAIGSISILKGKMLV